MVNIDRDEINIEDETILDTYGTGGNGTNTFNVSTATALVVAGGGVKVAKYGQRTESNYCGSAKVLEALGLKLDISRTDVERSIREIGIGFLYAPLFYGVIDNLLKSRQQKDPSLTHHIGYNQNNLRKNNQNDGANNAG